MAEAARTHETQAARAAETNLKAAELNAIEHLVMPSALSNPTAVIHSLNERSSLAAASTIQCCWRAPKCWPLGIAAFMERGAMKIGSSGSPRPRCSAKSAHLPNLRCPPPIQIWEHLPGNSRRVLRWPSKTPRAQKTPLDLKHPHTSV